MTKAGIEELIQKQTKISERNYNSYQETGVTRYLKAYENAEDLIEIARQALSAADDHEASGRLMAELREIISQAIRILHTGGEEEAKTFFKNLEVMGRVYGVSNPWN